MVSKVHHRSAASIRTGRFKANRVDQRGKRAPALKIGAVRHGVEVSAAHGLRIEMRLGIRYGKTGQGTGYFR